MGAFKKAVVTNKGKALLAKAVAGTTKLEFTQIAVSENVLAGDPVARTDIGTIKQAKPATSVLKDANNNVRVSVGFNNSELTMGYYVRNVGLFAKDPDEGEILYSVSIADESTQIDYMPPFTGVGVSSLVLDLVVELMGNSEVEVVVEDTTQATVGQVLALEQRFNALTPASIGATTQEYVDSQIALITETGIPKLMVYPVMVTAGEDNQTVFNITLDTFDINTDTVFVQSGRTMLFPEQDFSIVGNTVVLKEGVPFGRTIGIYVFKNVPLGDDGNVSGTVIAPNTLPLDRLEETPALAKDHNMKTYTELSHIGLSDADLSADNFVTNLSNIVQAMPSCSTFSPNTSTSKNLQASLKLQLANDTGLVFSSYNVYLVIYKYTSGSSSPAKIEAVHDTTAKKSIFTAYYDATTGGSVKYYPFIETYNGVGFFSSAGGTISGDDLYIGNGLRRIASDGTGVQLDAFDTEKDTNNRSVLKLFSPSNKSLAESLQLTRLENGGGNTFKIYGEHNKSVGSYVGNGTVGVRQIQTGGIGNWVAISSGAYHAIAGKNGAISWGENTNVHGFTKANIIFYNGVLTINTDDARFNGNGETYEYYVF